MVIKGTSEVLLSTAVCHRHVHTPLHPVYQIFFGTKQIVLQDCRLRHAQSPWWEKRVLGAVTVCLKSPDSQRLSQRSVSAAVSRLLYGRHTPSTLLWRQLSNTFTFAFAAQEPEQR
jgi:hypothetical protein